MSSILKALKKLEEEQSIRRPETLHIDTEILRGRPARRTTKTGIALAATLLFLCGAAATYFSMKQSSPPASSPPAVQTSVKNLTPDTETVVVIPPRAASIDISGDQHKSEPRQIRPPEPTQSVPASKVPVDHLLAPAPVQKIVQHETAKEAVRQTNPGSANPQLTVNGIAFQEGSADNIAVVNGVSVVKGSVIEGIIVAEILKDRVRFSINGETVDVGLGKSNR